MRKIKALGSESPIQGHVGSKGQNQYLNVSGRFLLISLNLPALGRMGCGRQLGVLTLMPDGHNCLLASREGL